MRVYCYQTLADITTQEQLWLCSEAVSAGPIGSSNRFYIREDRLTLALILDPTMTRKPSLDYYV